MPVRLFRCVCCHTSTNGRSVSGHMPVGVLSFFRTLSINAESQPTRMSITPEHWGPNAWSFLHTLAYAYPVHPTLKQQQAMQKLLTSLTDLLPCSECRQHWAYLLSRHPMPLGHTTQALPAWLVDRHNDVNKRLGKKLFTHEMALRLHTTPPTADTAVSCQRCSPVYVSCTLGIVAVCCCWYMLKDNKAWSLHTTL